MPSRADVMSVIGRLESLGTPPAAPTPSAAAAPPFTAPAPPPAADPAAQVAQAAQARHDQDAAALRDLTAERDAWRAASENFRAEVQHQLGELQSHITYQGTQADGLGLELEQLRQYTVGLHRDLEEQQAANDVLRGELARQQEELAAMREEGQARDSQVAHLSAAITALLELAHARFDPTAAPVTAPVVPTAARAPRRAAAVPDDVPRTQPAPPAVDPDAPPMVIPSLAPERTSPVESKPRLGVQRTVLTKPPQPKPEDHVDAPAAPASESAPFEVGPQPVPVTDFALPEPVGVMEVLPATVAPEKKRRRLG